MTSRPDRIPDSALRRAVVKNTAQEVYVVHESGFVEVDSVYGDQEDVLRRARVTTRKLGLTFGSDKGLLNYLWSNGHTSPFGFVQVTLFVRAPIFVARQWFRHRTGTRNEIGEPAYVETDDPETSAYHEMQEFSGRYAPYEPAFYLPSLDYLQEQSGNNHQARNGIVLDDAATIQSEMKSETDNATELRSRWMKQGLAREVARITTPLNQYVEWYWQQSLVNLLHWLELRRAPGAQLEIRDYARVVEYIIQQYFPVVYSIWCNNVEGAKLTRDDLEELLPMLYGKGVSQKLGKKLGLVD